jgi:hypothetical protein
MDSRPVVEADLPIWGDGDRPPGLRVLIDGAPGECLMLSGGWSSDKVLLVFDEPHPEFGPEFATKYFLFPEPGVLSWGHEGRSFRVVTEPGT